MLEPQSQIILLGASLMLEPKNNNNIWGSSHERSSPKVK